jgi:hypothetical protein
MNSVLDPLLPRSIELHHFSPILNRAPIPLGYAGGYGGVGRWQLPHLTLALSDGPADTSPPEAVAVFCPRTRHRSPVACERMSMKTK